MSIVSVRAALETKLDGITPALASAWENTPFEPQAGLAYQRVTLLAAAPDNSTYGGGYYREQGILQIDLMYPLSDGTAAAGARAELIRTAFKRGTSVVSGGVTVIIDKTPEVSAGRVEGDRWCVPVKVRWYAGIN